MKPERNAHRFIQGIENNPDEKADHRNCEFKQWISFFTEKKDTLNHWLVSTKLKG